MSVNKACGSYQTSSHSSSPNCAHRADSGWRRVESNPCLKHCRQILYQLSSQGSLLWIGEVHMERMISMNPDSCIFPYIEKHYIKTSGFLQLTVIFGCSDCPVFVAKSPMYPGSSLNSLEQSFRAMCEIAF